MNSGETSAPGKDSPPSGKTTLLEELLELGLRTDFLDFQLIVLTLLAGIVALFGLFLNNVAVTSVQTQVVYLVFCKMI
jgi:hypothetical protein